MGDRVRPTERRRAPAARVGDSARAQRRWRRGVSGAPVPACSEGPTLARTEVSGEHGATQGACRPGVELDLHERVESRLRIAALLAEQDLGNRLARSPGLEAQSISRPAEELGGRRR
jgi:hypothetical protein